MSRSITGSCWPLGPDTRFWQNFIEPVPEELSREWPGRTFILVDLAFDEAWRGQGLGRELTQKLLASRREQRAVLSVQPTATDTQAFYVHLGWRKVGAPEDAARRCLAALRHLRDRAGVPAVSDCLLVEIPHRGHLVPRVEVPARLYERVDETGGAGSTCRSQSPSTPPWADDPHLPPTRQIYEHF
jgi:GNAT superfamily N-acetyltransferase